MAKLIEVVNPKAFQLESLQEAIEEGVQKHPFLRGPQIVNHLQGAVPRQAGFWTVRKGNGDLLGWSWMEGPTVLYPFAQLGHIYVRPNVRPWVRDKLLKAAMEWAFEQGHTVTTVLYRNKVKAALQLIRRVCEADVLGTVLHVTPRIEELTKKGDVV